MLFDVDLNFFVGIFERLSWFSFNNNLKLAKLKIL